MNSRDRFLAACRNQGADRPPVWLMRQAGRYLPEYQALRSQYSFWDMVRTPALAAVVTLQPIRRFGMDAAILFSDILTVPASMGAIKLTLYLFVGSVVALVGVLAMYWVAGQNTGVYTFDMLAMEKAGSRRVSRISGSCLSSWDLQCWAASGPSTIGPRMVTWPRQLRCPCSMRAC